MSLVWEVRFPTNVQKLVMLKLADHASDNGESIFPAVANLAYQIGCDERSVQRTTRVLEACGLLRKVHVGGGGPRDTNRYEIDVDLLIKLACVDVVLEGGAKAVEVVENKGGTVPPSAIRRVAFALKRVAPCRGKGDTQATQTFTEPSIEPQERAGARQDGDLGLGKSEESKEPPKALPSFAISRGEVQWRDWIEHLTATDPDLAADAEAAGDLLAIGGKWPSSCSVPPIVKRSGLSPTSKRITGEASE